MFPEQVLQAGPVTSFQGVDYCPVFVAGAAQIDRVNRRQRSGAMYLLGRNVNEFGKMRIAARGEQRVVKRHVGMKGRPRVLRLDCCRVAVLDVAQIFDNVR